MRKNHNCINLKRELRLLHKKLDSIISLLSASRAVIEVVPFSTWVNDINIDSSSLVTLFSNINTDIYDWVIGYILILKSPGSKIPLRASSVKKSGLSVYENDQWVALDDETFKKKFVDVIYNKIYKVFLEWKNEHKTQIMNDDIMSTCYLMNCSKILSFISSPKILKRKLYDVLCENTDV